MCGIMYIQDEQFLSLEALRRISRYLLALNIKIFLISNARLGQRCWALYFYNKCISLAGQDTSVGKATRYRLDGLGIEFSLSSLL